MRRFLCVFSVAVKTAHRADALNKRATISTGAFGVPPSGGGDRVNAELQTRIDVQSWCNFEHPMRQKFPAGKRG